MGFSTHLRCDRLVEIASDYLERALSARDAEQLEQHLVICGACAEYVAQIRAVRDVARQLALTDDAPLDDASDRALRGLLARFKRGGEP